MPPGAAAGRLPSRGEVIQMAKSNVRVDLDLGAIEDVVADGVREMAERGELVGECPRCRERVTFRMPQTTCPSCGETFRVEMGDIEL